MLLSFFNAVCLAGDPVSLL